MGVHSARAAPSECGAEQLQQLHPAVLPQHQQEQTQCACHHQSRQTTRHTDQQELVR